MSMRTQGDATGARPTTREAMESLRAAQKASPGTPLYSRLVNRPLGRVLALVALRLGLTPNTVSLVSAAFSFTGIGVLALSTPSPLVAVVVAALLVIGYALDSADGQVARATGAGAPSGEWLDHMVDAAKIASLHAAVAWSALSHAGPSRLPVVLALGFGVVASVTFFGMILTDQLRRAGGLPKQLPTSRSSDLVRAVLVLPSDYGLLCLVFLLLGWPSLFYGAYGLLAAGSLALLLVAVSRWWSQMRGLTPAGEPS